MKNPTTKSIAAKTALSLFFVAAVIAATNYPNSVVASNFVLNPANALDADYDYATLQYATSISCPSGNFKTYAPAPNNFCQHNTSGQIIGGWEVVSFNTTLTSTINVTVTASDLNLGCTSCSLPTGLRVFYTNQSTYNNGTVWTYLGSCELPDNANQTQCSFSTGGASIQQLIVSRNSGGNHRPDPAVHSVSVIT